MATTATTEIRNFVGGEERPDAQYGSEPILNPATEEEIATAPKSGPEDVDAAVRAADADLVIGAVLVPGARAPKLVTREMLGLMKRGAVLVDVAIDQGGCFETSRPTTHTNPTYEVDGITHYCVTNMPGAVPITSTYALTNATLPYVLALADLGVRGAIERDPGLRSGVNVAAGQVTYAPVAQGVGMPFTPVEEVLGPQTPQAA